MSRRTVGRVRIVETALVINVVFAVPSQLTAQSRADSLAFLSAVLDHVAGVGGTAFLAEDSPELVTAAADRLPPGRVAALEGRPVFCGGEIAAELVRPGDLVGRRISISLTPGVGPPRAPLQDSATARPITPRDYTNVTPQIVSRAFYLDGEVGYVAVSFGCLMRPGGVSVAQRLRDGRVAAAFGSGATYELRLDAVSGWQVVATTSRWIT